MQYFRKGLIVLVTYSKKFTLLVSANSTSLRKCRCGSINLCDNKRSLKKMVEAVNKDWLEKTETKDLENTSHQTDIDGQIFS